MICGAITYESRSPLAFSQINMDTHEYFHDNLEPVAITYRQQLENRIFQQDNARPRSHCKTSK